MAAPILHLAHAQAMDEAHRRVLYEDMLRARRYAVDEDTFEAWDAYGRANLRLLRAHYPGDLRRLVELEDENHDLRQRVRLLAALLGVDAR